MEKQEKLQVDKMSLFGACIMSLVEGEHLGESENIEIAKGKNQAVAGMKEAARKLRRAKAMRKRLNLN